MKKPAQHLIAEVRCRQPRLAMTIGIDLGDVWSHYCTLNEDGEVVDRGRFRTTPKAIEKWFTDVPQARIAMEAGTHSIWISQQLQELGLEVVVANVRELRAITHSDRKSDQVDAEKLARYARLDPEILRILRRLCVLLPFCERSANSSTAAGREAHLRARKFTDPIDFPGLAAIGRERLLHPGRTRRNVQPDVADKNHPTFKVLLVKKLALIASELTDDWRKAELTLVEIEQIDAPLTGFRPVKPQSLRLNV
jgi:transposase